MDATSLSFDWFILGLRAAFIFLIYFFLYQVAKVSLRELMAVGVAASDVKSSNLPSPTSALEVVDPAESTMEPGTRYPLEHYTTVGRRNDNTLAIDDSFISGNHAEIVFEGGEWWLHDLGSTNGTFVNGAPARSKTQVRTGDIVQFGRTSFTARL